MLQHSGERQLRRPDLEAIASHIQFQSERRLSEALGPNIELTSEEAQIGVCLEVVRETEPGSWYVQADDRQTCSYKLCDQLGIDRTVASRAVTGCEALGLLEVTRRKVSKEKATIENVRATDKGRTHMAALEASDSPLVQTVGSFLIQHSCQTILLLRREINHERAVLGEPPCEFTDPLFLPLQPAEARERHLEELRQQQSELLSRLNAGR